MYLKFEAPEIKLSDEKTDIGEPGSKGLTFGKNTHIFIW
jgi:hypothetical protein